MNEDEKLILLFGINEISQIVQKTIEEKFNMKFTVPELIVLVGIKVYDIKTQDDVQKMINDGMKIGGKLIADLISQSLNTLTKKGLISLNGNEITVSDFGIKVIDETIKKLKFARWFFLKTNEITSNGYNHFN